MASGQDHDFRERIRASFDRQGAMALIGAELTRIHQGTVEIELANRPELTQQHGFLHAGVIAAALDSACTYAAYTMIDPDVSILTIVTLVILVVALIVAGDAFAQNDLAVTGLTAILTVGLSFLYFIGPWTGSSGATLGMRSVGLRVVSVPLGRTLEIGPAVVRWVALGWPAAFLALIPVLGTVASWGLTGWTIVLLLTNGGRAAVSLDDAQSPTDESASLRASTYRAQARFLPQRDAAVRNLCVIAVLSAALLLLVLYLGRCRVGLRRPMSHDFRCRTAVRTAVHRAIPSRRRSRAEAVDRHDVANAWCNLARDIS